MKRFSQCVLVVGLLFGFPSFAQTPIRFLEFPAPGSVLWNAPVETNLPCNGPVRVTLSNFSTTPESLANPKPLTVAANPNILNQTLGQYNWATNGNTFAFYNTTGGLLTYRVTFTFSTPADPSKLLLIIGGLFSSSVATVSTNVTKVEEYITPSKDSWCTTTCTAGTPPNVISGPKVSSGWSTTPSSDYRNSAFTLLRLQSTGNITTLTVDIDQAQGDGLNFGLANVCQPCACQTAPRPDPDFQLMATLNTGNTSTVQVVATTAPLPTGASFSWKVEEIDAAGTVIGPVSNNPPAWWPTPTYNSFSGYTFQQKRRYRITRGVWSDCYPFTAMTKVLSLCSNCTN
ncbi:MAG TPA: hypothetical protein VNI54_12295 [Thermoanaerobaculia bacterium]|nr:hypothetical protein [Thermoanaerobaculia bacterium]